MTKKCKVSLACFREICGIHKIRNRLRNCFRKCDDWRVHGCRKRWSWFTLGIFGKGEPKDAIEHLKNKLHSLEVKIEEKKKDIMANNPSSTWLLMFRYCSRSQTLRLLFTSISVLKFHDIGSCIYLCLKCVFIAPITVSMHLFKLWPLIHCTKSLCGTGLSSQQLWLLSRCCILNLATSFKLIPRLALMK